MNERPPFPSVIDSTMIAEFRACPWKFFMTYLHHWKTKSLSVHLHAGASFARGLEVGRKAYWDEGVPEQEAIALGMGGLLEAYGGFECPDDSAKSADRMAAAYVYTMDQYPMPSDTMRPARLSRGHAIEFSFAQPLEFDNPETGEPLLYSGRFDQIVEYAGGLYGFDDKTTTSLGASWAKQWDLRCFDAETELLTPEGWKKIPLISEFEENRYVAQWAAGKLKFVFVQDVHNSAHNGPMVKLSNARLSQFVTPNHRILLEKRRGGTRVVEAGKLRAEDERHKIPLSGILDGVEKLPAAVQRYIVALQADGTLRQSEGVATEGRGHREHMPYPAAVFSFTKERKKERLKAILKCLDAEFTEDASGGIRVSGFTKLQKLAMSLLTPEKTFREDTFDLYDDSFLEELEHWDGWHDQYYTVVEGNARFVQTVAHTNGWRASVKEKINHTKSYVVCLSQQTTCDLAALTIEDVPDWHGKVYCLSVPSGFVLTRRDGVISVSGNSQFTAYCWGARLAGFDVKGFIIRGVAILKTKFDTQQAITYRAPWQINQWLDTLYQDLADMRRYWENTFWKRNLSESCNAYGGCEYRKICLNENQDAWLPMDFEKRVWSPISRTETRVE